MDISHGCATSVIMNVLGMGPRMTTQDQILDPSVPSPQAGHAREGDGSHNRNRDTHWS